MTQDDLLYGFRLRVFAMAAQLGEDPGQAAVRRRVRGARGATGMVGWVGGDVTVEGCG